MTISINCSMAKPIECSFDVTEKQLDIMVTAGVDVTDDLDVAEFYRKHLGETIDGVYFMDLLRIADDYEHTSWTPEIDEWYSEGEAPEKYWRGSTVSKHRELERIFHVRSAYDCIGVQPCVHGSERCKPGTGGSHGRHNAEMHLTVRGLDAEVTLVISTGWDLPTVPAYQRLNRTIDCPSGAFVELHTSRPRYDGQDGGPPHPDGSCKDWAGCYVDAGYTMADEPTRLLVQEGSDAAWAWLEALYDATQAEMAAVV